MKKTSKYYNNPVEAYGAGPKVGCGEDEIVGVVRGMVDGWVEGGEVVSHVSGGITNVLHKVKGEAGEVLVRLYGENTDMLIDRDEENRILAELSKAGFAPGFLGKFETGRLEEFLPYRPLQPAEMSHPDFIPAISKELLRLHSLSIPPVKGPGLIPAIMKFWRVACSCEFSGRKAEEVGCLRLDEVPEEMKLFEAELEAVSPFMREVVFSHKDLLAGNILVPLSHESGVVEKVQIIDYEYSEWDFRGFDFGNHFAEHAGFDCDYEQAYPSHETKKAFIEGYLNGMSPDQLPKDTPIEKLISDADLFAVASHMYWGLWAIVQARYSPIDFDFMNFARQRLAGYHYHKQFFFSEKAEHPKTLSQIYSTLAPPSHTTE